MNDVDAKLNEFRKREGELRELHQKSLTAQAAVTTDYDKKFKALRAEYEAAFSAAGAEYVAKLEPYRAELKAWLGVTEGEPTNLLSMVELVRRTACPRD